MQHSVQDTGTTTPNNTVSKPLSDNGHESLTVDHINSSFQQQLIIWIQQIDNPLSEPI